MVVRGLTNIAKKRREVKGKGERKDMSIQIQSSKEEKGELRKSF